MAKSPETTALAQNQEPAHAAPAPSSTVKVRVRAGRLMLGRTFSKNAAGESIDSVETFAEQGEVVDMDRGAAERLLARSFDGYPSHDGQPGKFAKLVNDSPIELVQQL